MQPDQGWKTIHALSPDGVELTVCRPELPDAERERRMELTRKAMCRLYEAWCRQDTKSDPDGAKE